MHRHLTSGSEGLSLPLGLPLPSLESPETDCHSWSCGHLSPAQNVKVYYCFLFASSLHYPWSSRLPVTSLVEKQTSEHHHLPLIEIQFLRSRTQPTELLKERTLAENASVVSSGSLLQAQSTQFAPSQGPSNTYTGTSHGMQTGCVPEVTSYGAKGSQTCA